MRRLGVAIAATALAMLACDNGAVGTLGGQGGTPSSNGGSPPSNGGATAQVSSGGSSTSNKGGTSNSSNGGSSTSSNGGTSTTSKGGTTSNSSGGTSSVGGSTSASAGGTTSSSSGGTSSSAGGTSSTSTDPLGGYHIQGDWAGFAFVFASGGATITPDPAVGYTTMVDKDGPYCGKGNVAGTTDYSSIAAVGFNTKQDKVKDAPTGKIVTTSTGILLNITNNETTTKSLRVQIEDGTDPTATDAAKHRWCVNISDFGKDVTIPWTSFNTECWSGGAGTAFDPTTAIAKVIVYLPDDGKTTQKYDFCVNKIGPADVKGRGTGTLVSSCNNTVSWSTSSVSGTTDNVASGDGKYRFQSNGWNMSGGSHSFSLLTSCGYKVNSQTCDQTGGSGKPCSFPSIYIGTSADSKPTSGNGLPKQISAIKSIPTCLGWSAATGGNGEYNVSYDVWINSSSGANTASPFLMVWLRKPPSFQPGGNPVADGVVIGSQTWTVWWGDNGMGTNVVSYLAPSDLAQGQAYSFNLKDFIDDAVERKYVTTSQYLVAVMGGMEIWGGGSGASITGFKTEVQ
jgi:hypothetical protein